MDEIKHGVMTSGRDNWFEHHIGAIGLRICLDSDDYDIVHFQITGFENREIATLEELGQMGTGHD